MSAEDSRRSPRLLVVDDEVRILTALCRSLRREAYQITIAETPAEALRLLAEQPFDLVLSDHKMPRMSGLELLAEAARMRPRVARVLITGWTEAVPAEELARHGIQALIPKPWDNQELKQTLRDALARDHSALQSGDARRISFKPSRFDRGGSGTRGPSSGNSWRRL